MRSKQTTKPAPSKNRRRRAAIMALIAVFVMATMFLARYAMAHRAAAASTTPQEPVAAAVPEQATPAPAPAAPHRSRPAAKPVQKHAPVATTSRVRDVTPTLAEVARKESATRTPVEAPAPVTVSAPVQPPVTLTGCLETTIEQDQFRLTDIVGDDVPKERSWKSGFLKKHPAPVALVNLSDPIGARKLVGHKVTATGVMSSGEMKVRSLKTGPFCTN
jgi:hypothetical protein